MAESGLFLFLLLHEETGDDKEGGGAAHAGIGHIEGGPVIAVGVHGGLNPGEGEIQEIDHVAAHEVGEEALILCAGDKEALQEAVGHVADDAGGDERPGDPQATCGEEALAEQAVEPDERHDLDAEEYEGRPDCAMTGAKGHSGVVHAHEAEVHEIAPLDEGDDFAAEAVLPVVWEVQHDCPLGELVEGVEKHDEDDEPGGDAAGHGVVVDTTGALLAGSAPVGGLKVKFGIRP